MGRLLIAITLMLLPRGSWAGEPTVRLSVQPMAAPRPALKYVLLPELRDLNPGNPAQWYVRCFQEQRNFFFSKGATTERAEYRSMPLAELPAEKLRRYGGHALSQADWGARLDALDWQVLQRVQIEGLNLRLPELGPLRILPQGLQVRFRGEVARREFDDAVRTAQTMFALARHLGEHPTVVGNLDGLTAADLALDTLEEMIQQPGCPNLYWALTDLPNPLVDIRKGLQGHRTQMAAALRSLRDDSAMSETELEELIGQLSGSIGFLREQAGLAPRNFRGELNARINDAETLRVARARLMSLDGPWEVRRELSLLPRLAFPAAQQILLDEKRQYAIRCDAELKFVALAPWQIKNSAPRSDGLLSDFVPPAIPIRRAQARLEQRIAVLRYVEALRLFAADHAGQWPPKLSDIAVPLRDDPFTGKPFGYAVADGTVEIQCGGDPTTVSRQYSVTIRK
jgi:hypothetical protein